MSERVMPPEIAEPLTAQGGHHRVAPILVHCREDQPVCRVTTVQP
jgi:hypothetical protein